MISYAESQLLRPEGSSSNDYALGFKRRLASYRASRVAVSKPASPSSLNER